MATLTRERWRPLRLLARCRDGLTEALLLAYGFSIGFLVEVVADGLATAQQTTMRAPPEP
jgi:hypothetical protein